MVGTATGIGTPGSLVPPASGHSPSVGILQSKLDAWPRSGSSWASVFGQTSRTGSSGISPRSRGRISL
eukprot:2697648-Pyramimonas_sp.AAC.1